MLSLQVIGFVYGLIIEQFGWTVYIVLAGFAVSCVVSFFVLRYLLYLWGRNNVCKYIVNPRSFSFLLLYTRQFHQFLHIVGCLVGVYHVETFCGGP